MKTFEIKIVDAKLRLFRCKFTVKAYSVSIVGDKVLVQSEQYSNPSYMSFTEGDVPHVSLLES